MLKTYSLLDTHELCVGAVEQQKEVNSVSSTDEEWSITVEVYNQTLKFKLDTGAKCNVQPSSGGSSVSQNKLPQLILGYIYILKYLQSNFIG